jgi:hypothetical protein
MHIVEGGCTGIPRRKPPVPWWVRVRALLLRLGLIEERDDGALGDL